MEKTNTKSTGQKGIVSFTKEEHPMLKKLFLNELRDLYGAEKLLVQSLPKMEKAATSDELEDMFASHLKVTQNHVTRLEQIFTMLGESARAKKCEGMEGLVKEGDNLIQETEAETFTRDAGLIISGQKVENYEISAYNGLVKLAKTMGKHDVALLLQQTLKEEKDADALLNRLAESSVNQGARQEV